MFVQFYVRCSLQACYVLSPLRYLRMQVVYFGGAAGLIIRNALRIRSLALIRQTNLHLYSAGLSMSVCAEKCLEVSHIIRRKASKLRT
jgi:hypothetical protein